MCENMKAFNEAVGDLPTSRSSPRCGSPFGPGDRPTPDPLDTDNGERPATKPRSPGCHSTLPTWSPSVTPLCYTAYAIFSGKLLYIT